MNESEVSGTFEATAKTKDGDRREAKSVSLSALFSAMMESNAMLRKEIGELDPGTDSDTDLQSEFEEQQLHSHSLPTSLSNYLISSRVRNTASDSLSSRTDSEIEDTESDEEEGGEAEEEASLHTRVPLSITSVSSSSESEASESTITESRNNPFASPGESVIESMWDNFSVENYAPIVKPKERRRKVKTQPQKLVWSRRVTIPEPFAMTIRDEGRPRRPKSRAFIAVEQRRLEREMQEELECQKKFRALPVPATTYVPMEEIIRQEQNKPVGQESEMTTHQPVKPFSFIKREEEKQHLKQRQLVEMQNATPEVVFKARPVPESVWSPRVSEELKEKEAYRKILIKVRSQDMLARAQLPKNMQQEKEKREHLRKTKKIEQIEAEYPFHPKIRRSVPNHAELYSKFKCKIESRKEVKPSTTPIPFVLRTSSIPLQHNVQQHHETEKSSLRGSSSLSTSSITTRKSSGPSSLSGSSISTRKSSDPSSLSGSSTSTRKSSGHGKSTTKIQWSKTHYAPRGPPTVQMTEAAKLRQSACEQKMAECAEKEEEEEEARKLKREQQKVLRSRIIQQVQSCDHSTLLQKKQRERLKDLRDQDHARRTAYQRELEAMKQRLASRPLVFEQVSRDAARKVAEEKFRKALQKAGMSEDEIKFLDKQIATT